jgi:hypothetical protein
VSCWISTLLRESALTVPSHSDNYELIHRDLPTKTIEEIKEYADVFWTRYQEIEGECAFIASSRPALTSFSAQTTNA